MMILSHGNGNLEPLDGTLSTLQVEPLIMGKNINSGKLKKICDCLQQTIQQLQ